VSGKQKHQEVNVPYLLHIALCGRRTGSDPNPKSLTLIGTRSAGSSGMLPCGIRMAQRVIFNTGSTGVCSRHLIIAHMSIYDNNQYIRRRVS